MSVRTIFLIIAAFLAGGVAAFGIYTVFSFQDGQPQTVSGKALIGGPFSLLNQDGQRITEKDFAGKFMLVYFGYTYCPDICPAELQVMSAALDTLGQKASRVTPVFITVDPERDTVDQMKAYVENFHPNLVGLTGTKEEIRAVAKAYRVYYARAKGESTTDYLMDHASIVYLMGPDGEYLAHFPYGTNSEKMAAGIAKFL